MSAAGWRLVFWLAIGGGVALTAYAAWIPAKGWLSQQLLERAWELAASERRPVRPWPGADTAPVARLRQPRLGIEQIVLDGASGRVLAFGPGHVTGTARPGRPGNSVISAHRDTHFRWLQQLQEGDVLLVETDAGATARYVVDTLVVHHESDAYLLDAGAGDRLTLITCYPFAGANPGTPLRYVVTALRQMP
jgi:sortase A